MIAHVLHRLGWTFVILVGVSVIGFALIHLVPGDPVTVLLGPRYDPARAEALRRERGLDRPFPVRYGLWLGDAVRGDFGDSIQQGKPVATVIAERLPVTLELAGFALAIALTVGIPIGILAALDRSGWGDAAASVFGVLGVSVPAFWLGTMMILLFAGTLGWFPAGDFVPFTDDPAANLRHMTLPAVALGFAVTAVAARITRTSMKEAMSSDYVRTAHAKGLSRRRVMLRHVFKNALPPILTLVGIQVGYLLAGSVVIEEVFDLPGLGRLVLESIGDRDYPVLQGGLLVITCGFVFVNLTVDILHAALDPRMRRA